MCSVIKYLLFLDQDQKQLHEFDTLFCIQYNAFELYDTFYVLLIYLNILCIACNHLEGKKEDSCQGNMCKNFSTSPETVLKSYLLKSSSRVKMDSSL